MFDCDGGVFRDILKGLSEPTYRCDSGGAGIMPVKLTVVNGKLFVTDKAGQAAMVTNEFGVGFEDRKVLVIGDRYFLLDKEHPEIGLGAFKRPETKESIKERALNKLSKEERDALGFL